jgi:hypothetical protein
MEYFERQFQKAAIVAGDINSLEDDYIAIDGIGQYFVLK